MCQVFFSISPAAALVDQATAQMDRAWLAGDADAYTAHSAVYLALWPLAFADSLEASL